jgi:nitroreductase
LKKNMLFSLVLVSLMGLVPGNNSDGRAGGGFLLGAAEIDKQAIASILNHHGARNFIAGPIGKDSLDLILQAGARAPSANNRQPWHFTVVQTQSLAQRMVPNIVEGNLLIVISTSGDGKINGREILDCALATESMYLAAQALGLGSRIYTGPMNRINSQLKADLGLPSGYSAVALVRVGQVEQAVDGVSAASSRKPLETIVNYK